MARKKFSVVLVGLGNMGRNHLRVLREHPGFDLVSLVDSRPIALDDLGQFATAPEIFRDVSELSNGGADCAIIATPTSTHCAIALSLIAKGYSLLIEKPCADTTASMKLLTQVERPKGTIILVGHVERLNPVVSRLKEVVKNGWIGTPIHVNITRIGGSPKHVEGGNNVILDLAVHDFDVLQTVFGKVRFRTGVCHSTVERGTYDTAELMLCAGDRVTASVHVNWVTPTKVRNLRVTGSRGVCFVDYILQTCTLFGGNLLAQREVNIVSFDDIVGRYKNSDQIHFGVPKEEPLKIELDHFYRALLGQAHDLCSIEEAFNVVELAEEALQRSEKFILC